MSPTTTPKPTDQRGADDGGAGRQDPGDERRMTPDRLRQVGALIAHVQKQGGARRSESVDAEIRLAVRLWHGAQMWLPGSGVGEGLLDRAEELVRGGALPLRR